MTSRDLIEDYFSSCSNGTAADISAHFTANAVIYDSNVRPIQGNESVGEMWVKVRERWGGAVWTVDSCIAEEDPNEAVAAIEWSMTGTDPSSESDFVFRGSEHYRFVDDLIDEIRQYWTFDPSKLDTCLLGYEH
jgi:ketosteroid isomerase-like protein